MGGIISSLMSSSKSGELTCHRGMPFRFLELPAELRAMTYDLILPDTVLISLVLVAGHPQSRNEQSQRIRGYCNDCCRVHKGQAPIRHESIDTAVSLLQACHTTHTELAPRFYQTLRFQARPSFVANHFQECLLPFVKPAIQELRLMDYPYLRCYGEKAEKNGIEAAVKGLVGLRVLYWHGLDGSADANTKGTRWKPQELRKLAAVLKSSAQLRKAFYNPAAVRRHSSVRLTSVNGTARLNELELNVDEEYQNWLKKNKERRDMRRATA